METDVSAVEVKGEFSSRYDQVYLLQGGDDISNSFLDLWNLNNIFEILLCIVCFIYLLAFLFLLFLIAFPIFFKLFQLFTALFNLHFFLS